MSTDPPGEPDNDDGRTGIEPDQGSPPAASGGTSGRHAAPAADLPSPAAELPSPPRRARHRRAAARSRRRTALLSLIGVFVVVLGLLIGAATLETKQLDANVSRIEDAFPAEQDRPAESAGESQTYLVAGVEPVAGSDRPLLDAVLLVHVTSDRSQLQVVSVPVTTWVSGAAGGDGTPADGFQDDGAAGLVSTVEALSGVRVDHYVQVDFDGVEQLVDDLQGIDVDVPEAYANRGYEFPAGRQHLDGAAALAYLRDFGDAATSTTALREEAVITALFDRVSQLGAFSDLGTLTGLLSTLTDAVSVDDTIGDTDLVSLVWELRGAGRPQFIQTPTSGAGVEAGEPVLYLDEVRASALWGFLSTDTLGAHLDDFR